MHSLGNRHASVLKDQIQKARPAATGPSHGADRKVTELEKRVALLEQQVSELLSVIDVDSQNSQVRICASNIELDAGQDLDLKAGFRVEVRSQYHLEIISHGPAKLTGMSSVDVDSFSGHVWLKGQTVRLGYSMLPVMVQGWQQTSPHPSDKIFGS